MDTAMGVPATAAPDADREDRLYRRVAWRIMPLLVLCYVAAYLDRVNVGFGKLQMSQQLGFSETVFGLGARVGSRRRRRRVPRWR